MARTKDFDEDEVLKKAVCLFWHKGYNATSMQDLVDGLGISRSSLYDTYGDKHTLFIKALGAYKASSAESMANIVSNTGSAKEAIRQLFEFTTKQLLSDEQHKGCFLVNAAVEVAPHDKEVGDIVCQNDKELEEAFYKSIKRGQDSGEVASKQDARALARFILNSIKGIRLSSKLTANKKFFDDITNLTLSVLDQ